MERFLDYPPPPSDSTEIKEELYERPLSLLSPPITPSSGFLALPRAQSSSSSLRRQSFSSSAVGTSRHRPYPAPNYNRTRPSYKTTVDEFDIMSNPSAYGWNASGARSSQSSRSHPQAVERRSNDASGHNMYDYNQQFMQASYMGNMQPERPMTASSSLSGAMGDVSLSHSRHSRSPSSSHSGSGYNVQHSDIYSNMPANMNVAMNNTTYPGVAGHGGLSFNPNLDMSSMNDFSNLRNISPESTSSRDHNEAFSQGTVDFASMNQYGVSPERPKNEAADEIRRLKRRVFELEQECTRLKSTAHAAPSGLPSQPVSAAFQQQWKARTEARKKLFCSLNRAGNALCSWHDSRRERRVYPPRNAPPGRLNCGCTFEEALFEESLSRHGVGSYLPGETVRMDPALRNPLLKLLQERYGYKDGDFERDPISETWRAGEGPDAWEQKAASGQYVRKRADNSH